MTTRLDGTIVTAPIVAGEDTADDIASAIGSELQGAFQRFATVADRDTWASNYKTRLKGTTALVEANDDGDPEWYKWTGLKEDGTDGEWLQFTPVAVPTGGGATGITLDDGEQNLAGTTTINFPNGKLLQTGTPGEVEFKPRIVVGTIGDGYDKHAVSNIDAIPPLKFEQATSGSGQVVEGYSTLTIDHGAYEPAHAPGYLAYLGDSVTVIGKDPTGEKVHRGNIWFDDIIVRPDPFISLNKDHKAVGIQDYTGNDPNVTGGVDFLIAFRVGLIGVAPEDGHVRIEVIDNGQNFESSLILVDTNGQPVAAQREYKAGEKLDGIEVLAVVRATGIKYLTFNVSDNFPDDLLVLGDRTENPTGVMIQALDKNQGKTGDAVQQYEIDTGQNIRMTSHYLGSDIVTSRYLVEYDQPSTTFPAGSSQALNDGFIFDPIGETKLGVADGYMTFTDMGGINIPDFTFGRILSAEQTRMLRGHDVDVSITIKLPHNAARVAMVKWTGKPDEETKQIFTGRNNDSPVLNAGWEIAGDLFVPEIASGEDHTVAKTFVVPTDANNVAFIMYPASAQQPMNISLKELSVSANPAFTGYALKYPEKWSELHLEYDTEHKQFKQDTQGYASLRYTINTSEIPLPVGVPGNGLADVSLDTSVNQVSGSQAKGGEGALLFNADGQAMISTTFRLWSEKPAGTKTEVTLWFAKVEGDTFQEIPESEFQCEVVGGAKSIVYRMPSFTIDVQAGDRLALRGMSDLADGAFLECTDDSKPLVTTNVTFKELSTPGGEYDDPDLVMLPNDKLLVVDRRVVPFSGVTASIFVISGFTLPTDVELAHCSVIATSANGSVTSVDNPEFAYNATAQTLTVHIGTANTGKIYLEFWG